MFVGDDDVDFTGYYRKLFQKAGYSAVITQDGQACLKVYQKEFSKVNPFQSDSADDKPRVSPFDVVVLEYKPPRMNGIEVAKKILEQDRRQRIMLISSVAQDLMCESVHHLHKMVELVRKPFDPRGLVGTIEDVEVYRMLEKMNRALGLIIESRTDPEELSELLRRFRDKLDGKDSS
ncbi:MAG: response regulator [Nitrososphaera sp.]